ncbi:MAG: nucleoside-diphosphate sugar epimerase/dehydratase [Erysipelotrichia bacterium]|nr:nucleoside-diphosphate sugar epimerase/dehydratase [Erysipelotrichia bacterium]
MKKDKINTRRMLPLFDIITFAVIDIFSLFVYKTFMRMNLTDLILNSVLALGCVIFCRVIGTVYKQIWRFGGIQCYIRLIEADLTSFVLFIVIEYFLQFAFDFNRLTFVLMVAIMSVNSIASLTFRMIYRYCFKCGNEQTVKGKIMRFLLKIFAPGVDIKKQNDLHKIYVAIVGAGNVGVSLAEELIVNKNSSYIPKCFFDISNNKVGRQIYNIPVYQARKNTAELLKQNSIKEIIIALPPSEKNIKELYNYYSQFGCKIKMYDYPTLQAAGGKRQLREFDIEDLLFRKQIRVIDENTKKYFKDKVVLITGGGGSIGSELCRQLSKMEPEQIIILDIYENGVYDVQQELKFKYGNKLDLRVEIASITDRQAMSMVFGKYHPQILINAATHKHVPLMETNCLEAVKNNVFGAKLLLELCEEYGCERFMMVSTDKAVNPTNVMGATKRMCEMIAQGYSTRGKVKCSCTRFGNVLGSAGSVIPLFKRQIAAGGPITLTNKRIIRYFMTIPEASQLVLQSGAMANNGELFVLDMGQPIKIYDLAKNMIRLSGAQNIKIIETGLRPGEKLYEELLVNTKELDTTENELIFIEREKPISYEEVENKLEILRNACKENDNDKVREALRSVVPTFKTPEEVNINANDSLEMNIIKKIS